MIEFDVESVDVEVEPLESRELVADVDLVVLGYLDVAPGEDDRGVRLGRLVGLDCSGGPYKGEFCVVLVGGGTDL